MAQTMANRLKGMPTLEDLQNASASHLTERATTIIGVSYVEDALEGLLVSRFVPLENKEKKALFGFEGELGRFSSKIKMGYAMGIYGPITRDDLDILRDIRNQFAHSKIPISFATPEIRDRALKLQLPLRVQIPHPILALGHAMEPDDPMLRCATTVQMLLIYLRQEASRTDITIGAKSALI